MLASREILMRRNKLMFAVLLLLLPTPMLRDHFETERFVESSGYTSVTPISVNF